MRRIAIALAAAIVLAVPVAAGAASVDQTSDQTALSAYSGYLGSIVARAKYGQADDGKFVKSISATCSAALQPAFKNPATSKAVVNEVGQEIGADVAIRFLDEARKPYTTLAGKLNALQWSGKAPERTVRSFVHALKAVLHLPTSHLCRDAFDFSSKVTTEPAGTKAFLKSYLGAAATLKVDLNALVLLMERYETTNDAAIVTLIDNRATKFNKVSAADEKASRKQLVAALKNG